MNTIFIGKKGIKTLGKKGSSRGLDKGTTIVIDRLAETIRKLSKKAVKSITGRKWILIVLWQISIIAD